jgi:polysaccharide pyruvyl transferase WcaK-like protein
MPADAADAARELARCCVVVVSRLHAGILAALSETPVVALEYQPKCRDFALSIDDERSLIRTDRLSAGVLVERVLATVADSERIRLNTAAAVAVLRDRLLADYADARHQFKLDLV